MKRQIMALFAAIALLVVAVTMTKTREASSMSSVNKIVKTDAQQTGVSPVSSTQEVFEISALDDTLIQRMTGKSYHPELDYMGILPQLRLLKLTYVNFNGEVKQGEMIVNQLIAEDVLAVFKELYAQKYPIHQIALVDMYNGDDEASMQANNTSGFNMRYIAGTTTLSQHALGLAVDINPLYNPQVVNGVAYPSSAAAYADRTQTFPGKISEADLAYQLLAQRGFTWGGYWATPDYQHFERGY